VIASFDRKPHETIWGEREESAEMAASAVCGRYAGGPKRRRSTVLSLVEGATVGLRAQAGPLLSDVFVALKDIIPS